MEVEAYRGDLALAYKVFCRFSTLIDRMGYSSVFIGQN